MDSKHCSSNNAVIGEVEDTQFLWKMCDLFESKGNYVEALRAAEGAAHLARSNGSLDDTTKYVARTTALAKRMVREQKKYLEATECLKNVQKTTPSSESACAQSFLDIACVARQHGDIDTALMAALESVRIQDSSAASVMLCSLYYQRANYLDSIAHGRRALSMKQSIPALHVESLLYVAKSLEALGDPNDFALVGRHFDQGLSVAMRHLGSQHYLTRAIASALQSHGTRLPPIASLPMVAPLEGEAPHSLVGTVPLKPHIPTPPSAGASSRTSTSQQSQRRPHLPVQSSNASPSHLLPSVPQLPLPSQRHVQRLGAQRYNRNMIQTAQERKVAAAVRVFGVESSNKKKRIQAQKEEHVQALATNMFQKMVHQMKLDEMRAQKNNVKRIASLLRGFLARRMIRRWHKAAYVIQRKFRWFCLMHKSNRRLAPLSQQRMNPSKQAAAVIILQRRAKHVLRRLHLFRILQALKLRRFHTARRIQRCFRAIWKLERDQHLIREQHRASAEAAQQLIMTKAAIKIQSFQRGRIARKIFKSFLLMCAQRNRNANVVQSVWRGHQHRKRVAIIRASFRLALLCEKKNEKKFKFIQRMGRGYLERQVAHSQKCAHIVRQKAWTVATIVVQAHVRGVQSAKMRSQNELLRLQLIVLLQLQSVLRGKVSQKHRDSLRMRRVHLAGSKIVRFVKEKGPQLRERRALVARKQQKVRLHNNALTIQRYMHLCIALTAVNKKEVFLHAQARYVREIQRGGRGYLGRSAVFEVKRSTIAQQRAIEQGLSSRAARVQASCRRVLSIRVVRRHFLLATVHAPTIQRAWRCTWSRMCLTQLRQRKLNAFRDFSANRIQRNVRVFLQRRRLEELHKFHAPHHWKVVKEQLLDGFARCVQRVCRGYVSRHSVFLTKCRRLANHAAARRIQKAVRARWTCQRVEAYLMRRRRYHLGMARRATRVQAGVRAYLSRVFTEQHCLKERLRRFESYALNAKQIGRDHENAIMATFSHSESLVLSLCAKIRDRNEKATELQRWCATTASQIALQRRLSERIQAEYTLHFRVVAMVNAHYAEKERIKAERRAAREIQAEAERIANLPKPTPPFVTMAEREAIMIQKHIITKATACIAIYARAYLSRVLTERLRLLHFRNVQITLIESLPESPQNAVLRMYWDMPNFVYRKYMAHAAEASRSRLLVDIIFLQQVGRGMIQRRHFLERYRLWKQQREEERLKAIRMYTFEEKSAAAIEIQKIWRSHSMTQPPPNQRVRDIVVSEDRRDTAAVRIQCLVRSRMARKKVITMRHMGAAERLLMQEVEAAHVVEKMFRKHKEKREKMM